MITYEQICARNRRLYALLESLTARMRKDQPEGDDFKYYAMQITVVKLEIELNLDKMEVFLTKARDHATAANFVRLKPSKPRPDPKAGRTPLCPVMNLETGKRYRSIASAAKDLGISDLVLWAKVDNGIFFL